jgi:4-amino-4-deoxy-L-arabinose transferase-like glycosyltransferase
MNPAPLPTDLHGLLTFAVDTFRVRGVHYQIAALLVLGVLVWFLRRSGVTSRRAGLMAGSRISSRFGLLAVLIFCASLVLFSLPTLVTGKPITAISGDEYGYLLTADTFRHGRLSNPPHPLWRHFENFYVLQQPTYNSKYFPGQASFLAAGWTVLGHPMHGVRLSGALACVGILWMLRGWFARRWALLGALTGLTSFIVFDWNQTYLGGNVALLGGALCLGAVRRIVRKPKPGHALLLGIGLAVLSNSRPFEGLIFGLALSAFLIYWLRARAWQRFGAAALVYRVLLPLAIIMGLNFAWIGTYNHAVTGNALTFPYTLYLKQYEATPIRLFQAVSIPLSPTCVMEDYNRTTLSKYQSFQSPRGWALVESQRLATVVLTLISVGCLPFFAVGLARMVSGSHRWIPVVILTCVTGSMLTFGFLPQYIAHLLPAMLIVTVTGIRVVYASRRRAEFVKLFAVLVPVGQLIALLLFVGKQAVAPSTGKPLREDVEKRLRSLPGEHLVVVREKCSADNWGFVYNEAEIDAAKIVWARELGPDDDRRLFDYFRSRHRWLVTREAGKTTLTALSN